MENGKDGRKGRITHMGMGDLAAAYGTSHKTMLKWLRPHRERIGERIGRFYTPKQVGIIHDILGRP